MIPIKSLEEVSIMAEAGRRLAEVLSELRRAVRVGVVTKILNSLALQLIHAREAEPAFLNYRPTGSNKPYPYSLCVSINETVVHGLPSDYAIKEGDLVKLDLGLRYKGFYVDSAITIGVGNISWEAAKLMQVTREALEKGIGVAKPGRTTGDIGATIEKFVMRNKFSVIKSLTGHGIGRELHESPNVLNFGNPGEGEELKAGMVLAIEPMVAASSGMTKVLPDDSFVTRDGSLAAHFEHTVAIMEHGPRVLTRI